MYETIYMTVVYSILAIALVLTLKLLNSLARKRNHLASSTGQVLNPESSGLIISHLENGNLP